MDAPGRPLTKSSASEAVDSAADWRVTPHSYENQMVFTGDNYAISQIRVDDIEEMLLVTIDKVDRTQPFKLTFTSRVRAPPRHRSSKLHASSKTSANSMFIGLFYHSEDAASIGYQTCTGVKICFEYNPLDWKQS